MCNTNLKINVFLNKDFDISEQLYKYADFNKIKTTEFDEENLIDIECIFKNDFGNEKLTSFLKTIQDNLAKIQQHNVGFITNELSIQPFKKVYVFENFLYLIYRRKRDILDILTIEDIYGNQYNESSTNKLVYDINEFLFNKH